MFSEVSTPCYCLSTIKRRRKFNWKKTVRAAKCDTNYDPRGLGSLRETLKLIAEIHDSLRKGTFFFISIFYLFICLFIF